MRACLALSAMLLGLWSLQAFSQEPPPPDAPANESDTATRGWDGRLPVAPAPPAPAAGTLLYFDFSPGIILPDHCARDARQGGNPGAYRGTFNGGTFGVAERCRGYVDPLYPPINSTPPYYGAPSLPPQSHPLSR